VLDQLRRLAADLGPAKAALPLVGVGLSLGGTVLLNAIRQGLQQGERALDALVCLSSPLDLEGCSRQFDKFRNHLYRRWLVSRLRRQVLADPHPLPLAERLALTGSGPPTTIGAFDALVTVPRWGYESLDQYYRDASPAHWLGPGVDLPPTLLLHAADDPWVPVAPMERLLDPGGIALPPGLQICLAPGGGHNGFHAVGDTSDGSWSDRFTARWLRRTLCAG
jgi:predicted alpha/beta-fold hydrolase